MKKLFILLLIIGNLFAGGIEEYDALIQNTEDLLIKQTLRCEKTVLHDKRIENKDECKKAISLYKKYQKNQKISKKHLKFVSLGNLLMINCASSV